MDKSSFIFEIEKLRVSYGFKTAVNGVSLNLAQGESLGLLGANGAGKTSTIRALLGMLKPKEGSVKLFGSHPHQAFSSLGFVPEEGWPPDFLTAREYLDFVARYRIKDRDERKSKALELCEWFELPTARRIRHFSKGMKRRLVMAQALLGNPQLLILDEPLTGLDPLFIYKLRERLDQYRKSGGSVLFSSHILAEVEKVCTQIAMLSKGELVCLAPVKQLLDEFGSVEKAFASKVGGI